MENLSLGDALALTRSGAGYGSGYSNGFFGGDWAWIIILFLIFGWGGNNGFGNGFGNRGVGDVFCGRNSTCATPADVYGAVDQQTLISKLDQQTYGLADSTYALNNAITNGFAGVQQTLCQGFNGLNVAYLQGTNGLSTQLADCCCTMERGIDGINYNNAINTSNISRQISDCCCNLEKANMQSRFDAQTYNCNTLQAIDKLGDRIINHLTSDKISTLTAENQALKFQASQAAQNTFITANQEAQTAELIRRLGADCPVNAVVVQPNTPVTFPVNACGTFTGYNNNGCGCGCGNY